MHVRIAWEIYNHQQKQVDVKTAHPTMVAGSTVAAKSELLRPPTHMFPPRPHEMGPFSAPHRAPHPFESSTHPAAAPFPGLGKRFSLQLHHKIQFKSFLLPADENVLKLTSDQRYHNLRVMIIM